MSHATRTRPASGTDWAAALERLERGRFAGESELRAGARRAELERFLALGYPTRRQEAWRNTDVSPVARTAFEPASEAPAAPLDAAALERWLLPGAIALVFLDGAYVGGLSTHEAPTGLELARLASAADAPLGSVLASEGRPFAALNGALFTDGALVRVARGKALETPVQVLFASSGGATPRATHPRVLVVLEDGAQARVVETFVGSAGAYLTNSVTELRLGDGAVLDHVRTQEEGEEAYHIAAVEALLGRDASLRSHLFAFGAALSRTETGATFDGRGGAAVLDGLYLIDGERRAECRTSVDHAVPLCTSAQSYRGVLAGRARGAFDGRVTVRPGAWRSDARQSNRNLLLSRDAHVDTKPELEILNDDVKCSHGATVGQLDEDHVFYLRSRGIDDAAARAVLTLGFAREIVDGVREPALRQRLDAELRARIGARRPGGEEESA